MRNIAGGGGQRGAPWTDAELEILGAHPELTARELKALLPGRTSQAIGNMRGRRFPTQQAIEKAEPAVKAAGDYEECLSSYLVEDFECMEIWRRWNGYAAHRVLDVDERGWVRVLCTAK